MFKMIPAGNRPPHPQHLLLDKDTDLYSDGAIRVFTSDFFPSSFAVTAGGNTIFIDPVAVDSAGKADYIFITHAHPDHFSIRDIRNLAKPGTVVVCPESVSGKIARNGLTVKEVGPGDVFEFAVIKCEAVAAYNTRSALLWINAHPKSRRNVGYILTLNDTVRIYHAGDSDYIPEMNAITNITVALIPIGGDNLTMNVEDAAKITNIIRPQMVVPMHFELKKTENLDRFKELVDKTVQVQTLV